MDIGVMVYYIEDNVIKRSDVIATELRELGKSSIVVLTLRSGKRIDKSEACLSMQDVFVKLKREFEARERAKAKEVGGGLRANIFGIDELKYRMENLTNRERS